MKSGNSKQTWISSGLVGHYFVIFNQMFLLSKWNDDFIRYMSFQEKKEYLLAALYYCYTYYLDALETRYVSAANPLWYGCWLMIFLKTLDVLFRTFNFRTLFNSFRTNFRQKFSTLHWNITKVNFPTKHELDRKIEKNISENDSFT